MQCLDPSAVREGLDSSKAVKRILSLHPDSRPGNEVSDDQDSRAKRKVCRGVGGHNVSYTVDINLASLLQAVCDKCFES